MVLRQFASWTFIAAVLLAAPLLVARADADAVSPAAPPAAPPTDAELAQHQIRSLAGELRYAQALLQRLSADLTASEVRAKWAVGKLWKLPEPPAPAGK